MPDEATNTKPTNKERIQEIVAGIEDGIQNLFQSDRYFEYLRVMSRFHSYSVNNTMLIYMQNPNASRVAGFNQWKNRFGRNVKKGEKGITIIAPTPFKKRVEEQKLDPDTNAPVLDEDGQIVMEEKVIEIPMFKPVKVFDVSQTEGRPLPQLAADLMGDVQQYDAFMEALRRTSPVPIQFEAMSDSMDGYFSESDQRIAVREGMSEVQTVSAAVHEMGHALLHNREQTRLTAAAGTDEEAPTPKDRATQEVEAESVSYAVCQYYGIETGANSFGYIATWSRGKELKELRESLETITKTANVLITGIDKNFAEVCKERGIVLEGQEAAPEEPSPLTALPKDTLFRVDDKYLHIFQTEGVLAYTIYDARSKKSLGGGNLDAPNAKTMREVCEIVCVQRNLDSRKISVASMDMLPALRQANIKGQRHTAPDTPERFALDYCNFLEKLYQAGVIENPFTAMSKEEAAAEMASGVFQHGQYANTREVLVEAGKSASIAPITAPLIRRLDTLRDKWEASLVYAMNPHPFSNGAKDAFYIQSYEKTGKGLQPLEVIYVGSKEDCIDLTKRLNEHRITAQAVRELEQQRAAEAQREISERLYLLDGDTYLYIQEADDSFDYTLYDKESLHQMDGGQIDADSALEHDTRDQMEAALLEICEQEGRDPTKAEPVSLKMLDTLLEANAIPQTAYEAARESYRKLADHFAQEDAALWDTTLDEYPAPDASMREDALEDVGYMDGDMLPLSQEKARELLEKGYALYSFEDGTASMIYDAQDIDGLPPETLFGVSRMEWESGREFAEAVNGRMDRQEEREAAFLNHGADSFAIYQVKLEDDSLRFIRYESLEDLASAGQQPQRENYELAYTGPLPEGATLETLFEKFNSDYPADYRRPSLSVSDIVALNQDGVVSYHYCDSIGFQELPGFNQPENHLKNAELAMEDDANMIDGIINNGPKQSTVEEQAATVKAGGQISLTDLANATKAESQQKPPKRRSVLARLAQPLPKQPQHQNKAPHRGAEMEI